MFLTSPVSLSTISISCLCIESCPVSKKPLKTSRYQRRIFCESIASMRPKTLNSEQLT